MQASARAGVAAILLLSLSGCSTADSLFSYDTTSADTASVLETGSKSTNIGCAHIAATRADDAVMASYVTDGSAEKNDIYQTVYRDCIAWQGR